MGLGMGSSLLGMGWQGPHWGSREGGGLAWVGMSMVGGPVVGFLSLTPGMSPSQPPEMFLHKAEFQHINVANDKLFSTQLDLGSELPVHAGDNPWPLPLGHEFFSLVDSPFLWILLVAQQSLVRGCCTFGFCMCLSAFWLLG